MQKKRIAVAVFFAAFWLLGLLTAADYGPGWDEQDEMDILRMNLWEYARSLHLDEGPFQARAQADDTLTIGPLTPISQSIEQDHGIAAFYPLAGVVMSDTLSEGTRSLLWHMGCWTVFTLGAWALYAACRELGLNRGFALLGPVMLLLSPRFFAQGHYNNKDMVLFSLTLCLLWTALRLMRRPSAANGLWFGLAGAFAANTKVAGAAVFGLCGLLVIMRLAQTRRLNGRAWAAGGVSLMVFAAGYALLTPALWANPVGFFSYLLTNALAFQRWSNWVLFRGTVFQLAQTPLPWYYLPYMIVATTPLWALLLIAVGAVCAAWAGRRDSRLLLPLLTAFLPLVVAVLTRTTVYNGWRHFYFVYGPMLLLAVYGLQRLAIRAKGIRQRLILGGLAVCMLLTGVGEVTQHPHQQAYYQPLVQLKGPQYNELDYWNISVREGLERLAAQVEGPIAVTGCDLWAQDGLRKALITLPEELQNRFFLSEDGYVIVNPTYALFSGYTTGEKPMVTLSSYGQPILFIYPKGASAS